MILELSLQIFCKVPRDSSAAATLMPLAALCDKFEDTLNSSIINDTTNSATVGSAPDLQDSAPAFTHTLEHFYNLRVNEQSPMRWFKFSQEDNEHCIIPIFFFLNDDKCQIWCWNGMLSAILQCNSVLFFSLTVCLLLLCVCQITVLLLYSIQRRY